MKSPKIFTLFGLLAAILVMVQPAEAQNISVGGGLGYGSESKNLAFYGQLYYSIPKTPVRIGTILGYSIREKKDNRRTDRLKGNINGYLMVIEQPSFSLYGLTGLSILHSRTKFETNRERYTDTNLFAGANIGAGLEMGTGAGRYFAEGKYIIGRDDISGFIVRTGIRVGI